MIFLSVFMLKTEAGLRIFWIIFCHVLILIWLVLHQHHLGRGHIAVSMKAERYHLLEQRAAEWYFSLHNV